jgi:hypothetical protein
MISSTRAINACPKGLRLPLTQCQLPDFAVIVDAVTLDHLRLHPELGIVGIEGVEDRQGIVAGNVGCRPDRIERCQVGLGGEIHDFGAVCPGDSRGGEGAGDRGGRFQHIASLHAPYVPDLSVADRLGPKAISI